MSNSSDAPRSVWRRIPASSQPLTNPKPGKWESAGSRFPSHDTKSPARKQRQKQRWFKELQKWRTGCEGRISVLKRRHGLRRSLYKGPDGIQRWVGLGVIADNVIHIGTHLAEQTRPRESTSLN